MAVDPITAASTAATGTNKTSDASSTLDKNGFLKMLTAQIKNQDPSSGQDPNQYFQTISQMSVVEQITNLASAQNRVSAQSLLGHTVTYTGKDGKPVSGVVDTVTLSGTTPTISVDGISGIDPSILGSVK